MANDVDLGNLRHSVEVVVASQFSGNNAVQICRIDIELRQTVTYAASLRTLKYQAFVLCRMLCNFRD
jgi:hypothetical protein